MRRLKPSDFMAVWELASPHIDPRLKPDMDRARATYMAVLSNPASYTQGEWHGKQLVGAVIATSQANGYAGKGFASVFLWLGSLALLDAMLEWWEARPLLRFLSLQFPNDVRLGMYRALRMRGFTRSGDMNMLWR